MIPSPNAHPLVSVVIPVYNGAAFLGGAIRNVLEQGCSPLEIIVVDDGSSDDTPRVAARFGDAVRYVRQARRGPAAARNRGIRMARGEIISFLDVDDAWPRDKLRRQVAYLVAHPDVAIVQGLIVQMALDAASPGPEPVFEECSEPYQFVNLGSCAFRASVFATVGPFDESLYESDDTDWFFRAWEQNVAKVVRDQVALFYRQHGGNLTAHLSHPHLRVVRVLKRHLDRARAAGGAGTSPARGLPSIADYIGGPPSPERRARIVDAHFSIISNDCWGGGPYGHAGLMYQTPFIATRILAPCYIELLQHLPAYLQSPLEFIATSRYASMNALRDTEVGCYPIALLGGNVEVHFIHEPDEETSRQKWERRLKKIYWHNLFVKFSQDPEICTDAHLEAFDRLPYAYKVCFTQRDYPDLRSTLSMPPYFAPNAPMYFVSRKYFNSIGWINKRHGPDTQAYRLPVATRPV
jgi:uncharacterized protein (DUF1919 family)